jgi:hypothetical protein
LVANSAVSALEKKAEQMSSTISATISIPNSTSIPRSRIARIRAQIVALAGVLVQIKH